MIQIPINPNPPPHFSLQPELDGVTYTLVFDWNDRDGRWYATLADAEEQVLIPGRKVVPDFPLFARKRGPTLPTGQLIALDTSGAGLAPGLTDFGSRVLLLYIPAAEL